MLKLVKYIVAIVLVGVVFVFAKSAQASTYGSGKYGACRYSIGCSTQGATVAAEEIKPTERAVICGKSASLLLPNCLVKYRWAFVFGFLLLLGLLLFLLLFLRRKRIGILTKNVTTKAESIYITAKIKPFPKTAGLKISIDNELMRVVHVTGKYPNYKIDVERAIEANTANTHQKDTNVYRRI
jgi:hypothetical protein